MESSRSIPVAVALVTAVVCCAGRARADHKEDAARAEALFKEGRRLMTAQDYAAACSKFAESQALEPAPGTALNLATCYEKAGKLASAWAGFRTAQAAAQTARQADRARAAEKKAEALEPKLSHLIISVSPGARVPGLEIRCDGEVVGQAEWEVAVPRDGGGHDIEAGAPSMRTWKTHIDLAPSEQNLTVEVPILQSEAPPKVEPAPTPASAPPEAKPLPALEPLSGESSGQPQRIIGLSLGGLGVVAVGVGTFAGLKADSTYRSASRQCTGNPPACPADSPAFSQRDSAYSWATVSTITFVAGGALLAAGAIVFLTAPARGTSIGWTPTPGGARVSVGGTF
jgi:serine/threonine-protein kinase